MNSSDECRQGRNRGFTILEVLVSALILSVIASILVSMTDATSKILNRTSARISQFQSARSAFETMTRRLGQATLNTYLDYDDPNAPKQYLRQSELRCAAGPTVKLLGNANPAKWPGHGVFFQAPLGTFSDPLNQDLRNLLNTWGYFVEFGDDQASRPQFLSVIANAPPLAYRYRLMELMEPTESMGLYFYTSGFDSGTGKPKNLSYLGKEWFSVPVNVTPASNPLRPVRAIADNVLALVILPKLTQGEDPTGAKLCPKYEFDSSKTDNENSPTVDPRFNWKHQLPPVVQVTMISVDEASFSRFQTGPNPVDLLAGRFVAVGDLSKPDRNTYLQDLGTLETELRGRHRLNVRIFSTDVAIRAAKWSRDQAN